MKPRPRQQCPARGFDLQALHAEALEDENTPMPAATAGPLQRTVSIGLKYFAHDASRSAAAARTGSLASAAPHARPRARARARRPARGQLLIHVPVLEGFSSPELPALEKIRP